MKLMNESSPRGYSVHPLWKEIDYGTSCTDAMLTQYVANQSSPWEYFGATLLTRVYFGGSLLVLAVQGFRRRKAIFSSPITYALALLFIMYWQANVILMQTHFEQDVTFLTGGILHHAKSSKPALDKKIGTASQGYLLCGFYNRLFFLYCTYMIIKKDMRLRSKLDAGMATVMLNIGAFMALSQVFNSHPKYHAVADGGVTPELLKAWPWTFEWHAYYHVIVHHDKGYSFGGEPLLDHWFDFQLDAASFLHNKVFKLQMGTTPHYIFATVLDIFQSVSGMLVIWLALRIASYFLKPLSDIKSESAPTKTVDSLSAPATPAASPAATARAKKQA